MKLIGIGVIGFVATPNIRLSLFEAHRRGFRIEHTDDKTIFPAISCSSCHFS
jgi:hypothetical protein